MDASRQAYPVATQRFPCSDQGTRALLHCSARPADARAAHNSRVRCNPRGAGVPRDVGARRGHSSSVHKTREPPPRRSQRSCPVTQMAERRLDSRAALGSSSGVGAFLPRRTIHPKPRWPAGRSPSNSARSYQSPKTIVSGSGDSEKAIQQFILPWPWFLPGRFSWFTV